jgi:hypothetical protein
VFYYYYSKYITQFVRINRYQERERERERII